MANACESAIILVTSHSFKLAYCTLTSCKILGRNYSGLHSVDYIPDADRTFAGWSDLDFGLMRTTREFAFAVESCPTQQVGFCIHWRLFRRSLPRLSNPKSRLPLIWRVQEPILILLHRFTRYSLQLCKDVSLKTTSQDDPNERVTWYTTEVMQNILLLQARFIRALSSIYVDTASPLALAFFQIQWVEIIPSFKHMATFMLWVTIARLQSTIRRVAACYSREDRVVILAYILLVIRCVLWCFYAVPSIWTT